jgi:hypothetical protein
MEYFQVQEHYYDIDFFSFRILSIPLKNKRPSVISEMNIFGIEMKDYTLSNINCFIILCVACSGKYI